jgi:mannose-1-phosphate guanylyltransferase
LRIVGLDPRAVVAFFPSDHYYMQEEKFLAAVKSAFEQAEAEAGCVILLGAAAKHPEVQYGWIKPGSAIERETGNPGKPVNRFWAKPSFETAQKLLDRGCLWNMFVMAGRAAAFLEMIQRAAPDTYAAFQPVLSVTDPMLEAELLIRLYKQIPAGDFSKDVLAASIEELAVVNAGDIGWSDLGDPQRLITALFQSGIQNPWVSSGSCNQCGRNLSTA